MSDERTGITPVNKMTLRPGMNSFISVVNANALPENDPQAAAKYVAQWLANAIGTDGHFIGIEPTGMTKARIYNIGEGRPIHIWAIGVTKKRIDWYRRMGMPQGNRVVFVATSVDWRGVDREIEAPQNFVSVPRPPGVIPNNWPDGNVEQQKQMLAEARQAIGISKFASWTREANVALDKYLNNLGDYLIPDIVPGGGNVPNLLLWLGVAGIAAYTFINLQKQSIDNKIAATKLKV